MTANSAKAIDVCKLALFTLIRISFLIDIVIANVVLCFTVNYNNIVMHAYSFFSATMHDYIAVEI